MGAASVTWSTVGKPTTERWHRGNYDQDKHGLRVTPGSWEDDPTDPLHFIKSPPTEFGWHQARAALISIVAPFKTLGTIESYSNAHLTIRIGAKRLTIQRPPRPSHEPSP